MVPPIANRDAKAQFTNHAAARFRLARAEKDP